MNTHNWHTIKGKKYGKPKKNIDDIYLNIEKILNYHILHLLDDISKSDSKNIKGNIVIK